MVKIKQGKLNGTLRDVYLASQRRSGRTQREVKRTVRMTEFLHQPHRQSTGVKKGTISLYTAHSTAIGQLFKTLRQYQTEQNDIPKSGEHKFPFSYVADQHRFIGEAVKRDHREIVAFTLDSFPNKTETLET